MKNTLQKQAKLLRSEPTQNAKVVDEYTRQLNDIERLVKQHTDAQVVQQTAQAVQPDRDPSTQLKEVQQTLKKGLLDKSGDGLNSNVIKMAKQLQAALASTKTAPTYQPNQDRRGSVGSAGTVPKTVAAPDQQVKEAAGKYSRGFGDSVKDFKNIFTTKGFFDVENSSGVLGDVLKKKVARDDYIAEQQAMNPTASGDPRKDKARFAKQFEVVNKYRGQAKQATEEIEKFRAGGASEEQIARTDAAKKLEQVNKRLTIADPLYRERQAALQPALQPALQQAALQPALQPALQQAAKAVPVDIPSPILSTIPTDGNSNVVSIFSKSKKGLVGDGAPTVSTLAGAVTPSGSKETEVENLRLMQEQTAILSKIEDNTRSLAGLKTQGPVAAAQAAQPEQGGGGILSDIAGAALDSIGGAGKRAGRAAKGLGGKAMKFLGGKGGAIAGSALAVGAGAYTAYEGWQTASQNQENAVKDIDAQVAAGKITAEQGEVQKSQIEKVSNVEKGGAVGEGGGMAAGAIGGGIAGAKLGGAVGAMFGGVGAVPGALIGGALGSAAGAVAGSSVGKAIGGTLVSGYQSVKGFFGDSKAEPVNKAPVTALAEGGKPGQPAVLVTTPAAVGAGMQQGQPAVLVNTPNATNAAAVQPIPTAATSVSPVSPVAADAVYNRSSENAAAAQSQSSGSPVVINAPSNSTSTQNTIYSPKPVSRNSDSTMKNYISSRYAF